MSMFNRISVLNHGYKIQCNALCIVRYILILKHYFLFTWNSNLTKSLIFSFAKYGNPTLKGILVIFQVNIWTNDDTWMHYASVSFIIKKTILIFIALFSLSPTLRSIPISSEAEIWNLVKYLASNHFAILLQSQK